MWAACRLEMDDELTGVPSEAGADDEGMSAMAPGDEHDVMMSDVGAEADAPARDVEREQQREVPVECVVCVGDDGGGGGSEVRRGHEGEGGVEGCEGVDGVEQRAVRAAHEAEGGDVDEAIEGYENISLQHAEKGAAARQAASRSAVIAAEARSPRRSDASRTSIQLQGDVKCRGTSSACAAGLIPTCSSLASLAARPTS